MEVQVSPETRARIGRVDERVSPAPQAHAPLERLHALDAFRGFVVAFMLMQFSYADWSTMYHQLNHIAWNGWYFNDLFAAFFLLIIGMGMAFTFKRYDGKHAPFPMIVRIVKRTFVLISLGIGLEYINSHFPPLSQMRFTGPLQRIAAVYLLASLVILLTPKIVRLLLVPGCLLLYWALLEWVPVPGFGSGVLTPSGNFGGYVDRLVFGAPHLYRGGPSDPEGLLTLLPVLATVLVGYWIVEFVRRQPIRSLTTVMLIFGGAVSVLLAEGWNEILPINKHLWSGSYVVLTAGWAMIALGLAYEVCEVRGAAKLFWPFEVCGRNALLAYVGSLAVYGLIDVKLMRYGKHFLNFRNWVFHQVFGRFAFPLLGAWKGQLVFALCGMMVWWVLLYVLYRKRIFIRA